MTHTAAVTDEQIERAIRIRYKNWRGETSDRHITPKHIWWGSTEWHSEPQWLLSAFDHDKQADRDFALLDISLAAAAIEALEKALGDLLAIGPDTEPLVAKAAWMRAAATQEDGK